MKIEDLPRAPGAEIRIRMPDGTERIPISQVLLGSKLVLVLGRRNDRLWRRYPQERALVEFVEWVQQHEGEVDLSEMLAKWLNKEIKR